MLEPGEWLLGRGRSGSGKTTLLRSLAGLWPYVRGVVSRPQGQVIFCSQQPYLPQGALRSDDLTLMNWLRHRVWPMEAAHTPDTLRAAARLGIVELLSSGTTTVLTMETVHDTDVVFEAAAESGIRATIGKFLPQVDDSATIRTRESDARARRAIEAEQHGEATELLP